jgi:hypothetical protein
MPRSESSSTRRSIGKTRAVGLVTRRDRAEHVLENGFRRFDRKGHSRHDDPSAGAIGDEVERVPHRVVRVVGRQQLVAGREPERAQDGVDPGGRVRHEDEILRIGAEEGRELRARLIEQASEIAHEELHRLSLDAIAPALLLGEDFSRAGAERAVVQKGERGIETPEAPAARRSRHTRNVTHRPTPGRHPERRAPS